MSDIQTRRAPGSGLRGFSAPLILLAGLVGAPLLLMVVFNGWQAPRAADYVQMAFISVACSTIAIVTVFGLLIVRVARRAPLSSIGIFAVIALVVVVAQIGNLQSASDLLLSRLDLS